MWAAIILIFFIETLKLLTNAYVARGRLTVLKYVLEWFRYGSLHELVKAMAINHYNELCVIHKWTYKWNHKWNISKAMGTPQLKPRCAEVQQFDQSWLWWCADKKRHVDVSWKQSAFEMNLPTNSKWSLFIVLIILLILIVFFNHYLLATPHCS